MRHAVAPPDRVWAFAKSLPRTPFCWTWCDRSAFRPPFRPICPAVGLALCAISAYLPGWCDSNGAGTCRICCPGHRYRRHLYDRAPPAADGRLRRAAAYFSCVSHRVGSIVRHRNRCCWADAPDWWPYWGRLSPYHLSTTHCASPSTNWFLWRSRSLALRCHCCPRHSLVLFCRYANCCGFGSATMMTCRRRCRLFALPCGERVFRAPIRVCMMCVLCVCVWIGRERGRENNGLQISTINHISCRCLGAMRYNSPWGQRWWWWHTYDCARRCNRCHFIFEVRKRFDDQITEFQQCTDFIL